MLHSPPQKPSPAPHGPGNTIYIPSTVNTRLSVAEYEHFACKGQDWLLSIIASERGWDGLLLVNDPPVASISKASPPWVLGRHSVTCTTMHRLLFWVKEDLGSGPTSTIH